MITIIDYDAGNTCSVMNALKRIGADFVLTDDAETIRGAEKVIFPGVGHAAAAMEALRKKDLVDTITSLNQPVLGICVGMQLLCQYSEEGDTPCLGILDEQVLRFKGEAGSKVPHMGWNDLAEMHDDGLLKGLDERDYFYFVHSYYVTKGPHSLATCHHEVAFSAIVKKENFYGIQFHAEKSGASGERLIKNFIQHS